VEPQLYEEMASLEDAHWWFRGRRDICRDALERHLPARRPLRLLDVGCGTGGNLPMLQQFGEVEGLELDPGAVARSRARLGDASRVHQGALPDGIPRAHPYDAVTALDVLEHLEDPEAALAAIARALVPGGVLLCTVPAFMFLWTEHDEVNHHHRRYRRALLSDQLRSAGFQVRHVSYFNSWLFPPIAALRLVRRLWPRPHAPAPAGDLAMPPRPLNALLARLFASERHLVTSGSLPFGVSLLAVGVRPAVA
jgi:SAM-dependent methyltransferase